MGALPQIVPQKTEFSKVLKTVLRGLNFEPFGENRMSIAFFVEEEFVFRQTHRHPYFINIYKTRADARRSGLAPSEPSPKVTEGLTPFNPPVGILAIEGCGP